MHLNRKHRVPAQSFFTVIFLVIPCLAEHVVSGAKHRKQLIEERSLHPCCPVLSFREGREFIAKQCSPALLFVAKWNKTDFLCMCCKTRSVDATRSSRGVVYWCSNLQQGFHEAGRERDVPTQANCNQACISFLNT